MRRAVLVAVLVVLTTSCGARSEPADDATLEQQIFTITAIVLESADHGPELCAGGATASLAPICGGPEIPGWDWSAVESESLMGTTWGEYMLVGTYDGDRFTLTEPPQPPPTPRPVEPPTNFSTPCDPPPGGWKVVDADRAKNDSAAYAAVGRYVEAQPDHAAIWVDDPIVNIAFTGDVAGHEQELRTIWGGMLCVFELPHPLDSLQAIVDRLPGDVDGLISGGVDVTANHVDVTVIWDDGSLQRHLDQTYGEGVVEVSSALMPVTP